MSICYGHRNVEMAEKEQDDETKKETFDEVFKPLGLETINISQMKELNKQFQERFDNKLADLNSKQELVEMQFPEAENADDSVAVKLQKTEARELSQKFQNKDEDQPKIEHFEKEAEPAMGEDIDAHNQEEFKWLMTD